MGIGNLNRKFGWLWLLIAPIMGLIITALFNSRGSEYSSAMDNVTIAGENLELYMGHSFPRIVNRLVHVHAGLLAFLNIFYGMNIDSVPLNDKTRKLGSILAVVGTVFVTVAFYLFQFASLSAIALPLRILGGIGLVVAILILVVGEFKRT